MTEKTNSSGSRIKIFDGLKGIAIVMILLYYFFQHILPGGYLAVNLFLLIAGFFNFRHFYTANEKGLKVKYSQFYLKRFSRLFFPMLAMIISSASFVFIFARDSLYNMRNMALSSLLFLNNYYQIFNEQSYFVQAANPSIYTHLWYVAILGQLILLTPLIIQLFYSWHKKPSITVNMLLILTIVSAFLMGYLYSDGGDPSRIYYDVLTRAFAYTLGGAIGLLFPPKLSAKAMHGKVKWIFNTAGLLTVIILFFMLKFMYGTQPFAYRIGMFLFTLLCGLLIIVSIHPSTVWNKIFSIPLFTALGKRSYSYYLWFYPIYLILPTKLRTGQLNIWMINLIQIILIVVISEISYRLFEQKQISLPIGQDFNLTKTKHQFNYLRQNKRSLLDIKALTVFYIVVFVVGSIGIIAAPEDRAQTAQELQAIIEANQQIAEETQTTDTENVKVINQIDGLNQQEMLYANGLDITFIGDSVLATATSQIQNVFPKAVIDPQEGRQLYNSVSVVNYLDEQNLLRPTVVTILGSNGTFTTGQMNDYVEAIGDDKDIFFVTSDANRAWVSDANREILGAAQRFGNVHIIDWATYANDQPSWQRSDGAHPTEQGAQELAVFIAKEIYRQR